ncbi:hypothetical protein E1B28_003831 [Marasmius oreades]|uniref:Crinkler (CRN) family protein n=1 Tax=Marasmius oreades TaxID=181124 RepID=A0A9P8ABJ8_9AGAR|nr:uncharacterized protein E1B28_003831 [Marasmius oreades]KAG7096387.1 hypothetical protein E1B28_003831 [Marasmius oreades]
MAPDSERFFNTLDGFTNRDYEIDDPNYRNLYEVAWKSKDRNAIFEDVVGSEPYKSLKLVLPHTVGHQDHLLVTSEYKAALSDAKRWFDGREDLKTKFTQEESCWKPLSEDEGEGEDQQINTDADPDWPTSSSAQGVLIVCGMPGIGKSCFLYYVLVERLLANLPTCFQTERDRFTYWCDKGVFNCDMEPLRIGFRIPSSVWFLIDSNMDIVSPSSDILRTCARVIQAASPLNARLRWKRKQNLFTYHWFMKPSPLRELLIMRQFWPVPLTDEQVTEFVTSYGPSIRLITQYAHRLYQYRVDLQSRTSQLTFDKLRKLLYDLNVLNAGNESVSHWIFGIYPGRKRYHHTIGFHTSEVYDLVKAVFSESWKTHVCLSVYELFNNGVRWTRGSASYLSQDLPIGGTVLEGNHS